jgi:hypothetical protein
VQLQNAEQVVADLDEIAFAKTRRLNERCHRWYILAIVAQ